MKKLITLATACLSLGALVACGKGGEEKETKTEWTDEEKAIIAGEDGVLEYELPFYQAKLSVEANEEDGILYLTSGRKATAEDVEAYVALLDSEEYGYEEFDTEHGEPVGEDVLDFVDYADEEFEIRFKNIPTSSGGESVSNDVVAVGLTSEGKLVIAATIFYNYLDLNSGFQPGILGYTSYMEGWMANFGYTAGSVLWPSQEDFAALEEVDIFEQTLLNPFTFGNIYSEEFGIGFDMYAFGVTEEEYNTFLAAEAELVEFQTVSGGKLGIIEGDEGTTKVIISDFAEHKGVGYFEFVCMVFPVAETE